MNPLFQQNFPQNNMMNLMNQFQAFKNNFQGDPKQQVMSLLSSGKMSQEQFNYLSQIASKLQQISH